MKTRYLLFRSARWQWLFLLLLSLPALSQTKTITGKVTGGIQNTPLSGVSVQVKGQTNGTATNEQGNFSIQVPANAQTLVFTFIGYQEKEVAVGFARQLNVNLVAQANSLQ